jgi:hypothetical protein
MAKTPLGREDNIVTEPRNGGSRPVPDPTALTNELVAQATLALREFLESQIANVKELSDQKVQALTETVAVFKTAVNERFQLGDVQTEKAARDVKSAVDAAFAAAKEAVGEQNKSNALSIAKSELATTKQIDQIVENQRVSTKNTDDKIDTLKSNSDDKFADLKNRLVAMEARGSVMDPATAKAISDMAHSLSNLRAGSDNGVGRDQQTDRIGNLVVGFFAVLATLISLVAIILHFVH